MYQTTNTVAYPQCTAHITINRNRSKVYGNNSVYLKDGQNFEIELFNPSQIRMLAKITMNGKEISQSGIVLRPGERVYLQRFLDSNNKFVFETYEVENTQESMDAIQSNGLLEVYFYSEVTSFYMGGTAGNYVYPSTFTIHTGSPYAGNYNFSVGGGSISNLNNISFAGTTVNTSFCYTESSNAASIETGRVEKGDSSNQIFETVNGSFRSIACSNISIKLLPESQKPIESSSIRNYCTNCGTRMKKQSWKFCPSCGTKI